MLHHVRVGLIKYVDFLYLLLLLLLLLVVILLQLVVTSTHQHQLSTSSVLSLIRMFDTCYLSYDTCPVLSCSDIFLVNKQFLLLLAIQVFIFPFSLSSDQQFLCFPLSAERVLGCLGTGDLLIAILIKP